LQGCTYNKSPDFSAHSSEILEVEQNLNGRRG
jgi:hypothetical protein